MLVEQSMGGEDFAWMLQEVPGSMFRLGTPCPGDPTYDLHQGDYAPSEQAIGHWCASHGGNRPARRPL